MKVSSNTCLVLVTVVSCCWMLMTLNCDAARVEDYATETDDFTRTKRASGGLIHNIGRHLIVSSHLGTPFLMTKKDKDGNEQKPIEYEGFVLDLLKELRKKLNFTFTVLVNESYGTVNATSGEWTGMIGEVLRQRADIAVADLTITEQRAEVVDFTEPFMLTGIGILVKNYIERGGEGGGGDGGGDSAERRTPLGMRLMQRVAFTPQLWNGIIIALCGFAAALFVLGRLSGGEWVCVKTAAGNHERRNNLSIANSFWFALGSLTLQSPNVAPRALSTRLLSSFWWFFCITVVSCYIAGMSALMNDLIREDTDAVTSLTISDVPDLLRHSSWLRYGTIRGGSTQAFFKKSQDSVYQRLYATMEFASNPDAYVTSTQEAIERVKEQDYATFLEATMIEYIVRRNCKLQAAGVLLDSKGYGIALRKDSSHTEWFSKAIKQLKQDKVLGNLKETWWALREGETQELCDNEEFDLEFELYYYSVPFKNLQLIFELLVIGAVVAFVVALVEIVWKARKASKQSGGSIMEEVKNELKLSFTGKESPSSKANCAHAGHHDDDHL